MSEIISSSVSSTKSSDTTDVEVIEFEFVLENDNIGVMSISDPLLDTEDRARARALSEFLKNSYELTTASFTTFRTDLKINDVVEVEGLPYLIKSLTLMVNDVKIETLVYGVRYD